MHHPYAVPLADLFKHLLPEIVLVMFACIIFIGGLFRTGHIHYSCGAIGALNAALFAMAWIPPTQALGGDAVFAVPLLFDSLTTLTRFLALATGFVFILLSWNDVPEKQAADHNACVLIIVAGLSLIGCSNDVVTLFLALEMVSIPTYILLYLPRHDDASQEASVKYFLLSIFSSALLLFGFSYLFGLTGTTNIAGILQVVYNAGSEDGKAAAGMAQIAMLMVAAGLGFRITAVPFHFYAPDVFQGASNSGAAFLSYIPKIAGFIAILRVFGFVIPAGVSLPVERSLVGVGISDQVPILFWFLAALTMTIGNILALLQDNLKRLMAYSGVAHVGYMLVALASAPYLSSSDSATSGVASMLFYLVAYGTMTFGFFAVLLMLHRPERPVENVDDLAGLAKSHPFVALMVAVLMLSLIGFPLTVGFTGKFFVFFGAVSVQGKTGWLYPTLAVIGVLNSAVGAWYYLRIITVMYLRNAIKPVETRGTVPAFVALIVCVLLTVTLSVPPGANWLLAAARQSTARPAPAQAQR